MELSSLSIEELGQSLLHCEKIDGNCLIINFLKDEYQGKAHFLIYSIHHGRYGIIKKNLTQNHDLNNQTSDIKEVLLSWNTQSLTGNLYLDSIVLIGDYPCDINTLKNSIIMVLKTNCFEEKELFNIIEKNELKSETDKPKKKEKQLHNSSVQEFSSTKKWILKVIFSIVLLTLMTFGIYWFFSGWGKGSLPIAPKSGNLEIEGFYTMKENNSNKIMGTVEISKNPQDTGLYIMQISGNFMTKHLDFSYNQEKGTITSKELGEGQVTTDKITKETIINFKEWTLSN